MNKNIKKVMRLMEGNGLLQAFVINAIINEADKVIAFYEENPKRLDEPQIISPAPGLNAHRRPKKSLQRCNMNHLLHLNDYELEALRRALDIFLHIAENADDYPIMLEPSKIHINPGVYHYTENPHTVPFTDENLKDLTAIIAKVNCL